MRVILTLMLAAALPACTARTGLAANAGDSLLSASDEKNSLSELARAISNYGDVCKSLN